VTPPRIFTSVDALRGAHGDGSFSTPRQTADLVASVEHHMARADAAEAAAHQLTRERDGARDLAQEAQEARIALELAEARAEVVRLRAIVEGRTVPPTDTEIDAHMAGDGWWLVAANIGTASSLHMLYDTMHANQACVTARAIREHGGVAARWWPLDAMGQPCAWPVVDR
jgi:sirohydrochlorin ferrochelatase